MDKRRIDLIAIGIILILLAGAYFVIFRGEREKIATLKEREKVLSQELTASNEMNLELNKIALEIQRIQENLEAFDRQLPGQKRIFDFVRTLDRLGKVQGVQLTAIQPGDPERHALYSRVPVTVSAKARFLDFYEFLYQVENIPRITRMDRLSIRRTPTEQEISHCDIQMALSVFVAGD